MWRAVFTGAPSLLAWLVTTGFAQAQPLPPSPAALSESAVPVRVVCVADSAAAFLDDAGFRERVLSQVPTALPAASGSDPARRLASRITPLGTPQGKRFIVPVGTGFVVDPTRWHVVSNWHVVTACAAHRSAARQVGIIEGEGADIVLTLADRLPDRTFQDAGGRPVKLVQALCRDKAEPCGADLPPGPDDKPLNEAQRRRQLDNLLAYAPDLAVLRLKAQARAAPLMLALNQQLDDQLRLVLRAFGPVPVGLTGADAAARLHLVVPVSVGAVYTGPQQISHLPLGGQPGDEIHAKLHRLAATVQPGQAGGPLMRGAGVVGVMTTLLPVPGAAVDPAAPAPPAYAVPVTVLAVFLDLLKVAYITAPLDLPALPVTADAAVPAPSPAAAGVGRQALLLGGAGVLALLALAAFFALRRRSAATAPSTLPQPHRPQPPQRTVQRVNPTLLHAVAMPTAAVEPVPEPPPETEVAPLRTLPPPTAGVRLHASAGPLASSVFALPMPNGGTTLFVGRDPQSCQVVFPAAMDHVSAVHACFVWDGPQQALSVRDLSSSGTWVNGQRIAKGRTLPLSNGARVDLGGPDINRFTIEIPGAPTLAVMEDPR